MLALGLPLQCPAFLLHGAVGTGVRQQAAVNWPGYNGSCEAGFRAIQGLRRKALQAERSWVLLPLRETSRAHVHQVPRFSLLCMALLP